MSTRRNQDANGSLITEQSLMQNLRSLGVREGDHLALGVSFKNIGEVVGGAEALVRALLKSVGPDGTIMVNTFTEQFGLYRIKARVVDYVFDYRSTPCNTGLVPETMRCWDSAKRSKHPVTSVAAIGKAANFLTEFHDHRATAYSPFSRLAEIEGKYLSIGIGGQLVGFRHEAQYLAGLLDVVPKKVGVNYLNEQGEVELFINRQPPGCVKTMGAQNKLLEEAGIVTRGQIGDAESLLIPADKSLAIISQALKADPTINLCTSISCLWCRELERRLALYGKLKTPRYYQKNKIVISALALANWVRMGDNPLLRYAFRAASAFR